MNRPIKILFLAANPNDTSPLRLDEEIRGIDQALRQAEYRDKFDIKQHWAVRVTDLQSYLLRYSPDIVHFSGHGSSSSEIILEDNDGNSRPISSRALSQLFSVLKDNIQCVVLNACYSEQQAQPIAQHINCVVGMSKAIGDRAAISFAVAFYQALGYGRDIKTAFDLGCVQSDLEGLNEHDTPKLLAINSNPQEILFVSGLSISENNSNTKTTTDASDSELIQYAAPNNHSTQCEQNENPSSAPLIQSTTNTGGHSLSQEGGKGRASKKLILWLGIFTVVAVILTMIWGWHKRSYKNYMATTIEESQRYPDVFRPTRDAATSQTIESEKVDSMIPFDWVTIPAGYFSMGSDREQDHYAVDIEMRHTIYLPEYQIARTPVTVAQFRHFVAATHYRTTAEKQGWAADWTGTMWQPRKGAYWEHPHGLNSDVREDHPVTCVSWYDAIAFCKWAGVRLPSEAEWEKAAGWNPVTQVKHIYPWGNDLPDKDNCNFDMQFGDTTPVDRYPPNANGLYDMAGNVWEWTNSLYKKYPYEDDDRENLGAEGERVLRGGSFFQQARYIRCTNRHWHKADATVSDFGFRVCAVKRTE